MPFLMRCNLGLLIGLLVINLAEAQNAREMPFVEYPDAAANYLNRLHAKTTRAVNSGELSFRADYPGGFPAWQRDARNRLVGLLGLDRIRQAAGDHKPTVRLDDPIHEDGYHRQRGEIDTEPGVTVPFWLLTPDDAPAKKRPLAVCVHGHNANGWNLYAGVYQNEGERKTTLAKDGNPGVQAVKRGFVTIVPATRGLAAATSIPDVKGRHRGGCRAQLAHCLLAGRTAIGERVWDTQRILDWALAKLTGIDPKKVVLLGNSGGGVMTVYTAALDERFKVAVPCCSFTSFTSSTGYIFLCDCNLVPRVQVELADMADIGALTAPRALLSVHGRQDKLHSFPDVEAAMARVRSIYTAAGAPDRFQHAWGEEGHKFYPEIMWPFIVSAVEE